MEKHGLYSQTDTFKIPVLSLSSWVILDKLLNLSELRLLHPSSEIINEKLCKSLSCGPGTQEGPSDPSELLSLLSSIASACKEPMVFCGGGKMDIKNKKYTTKLQGTDKDSEKEESEPT